MIKFRIAAGLVFALFALRAEGPDLKLLDLNAIAVDNHGQPVNDLTIADFEITDAGKPQKISLFRHVDNSLSKPPVLAKDEVSNRGRGGIPHATVILFDLMNESFSTRGTAANQIIHALEHLENADDLYLYLLTVEGRLFAVHGLQSEDGSEPGGPPWTKKIKPLLDRAQRDTLRERPVDIDVAGRVQLTFAALDALGGQMSMVSGRKNVVWVTDGVPIELGPVRSDTGDFVDFTPQMRQLSQALVRSGIALYPVRQLMIGTPDHIGGTSDGIGETGGEGTGIQSLAMLNQLADMTGGRQNAGKDVAGALKQALNDVRVSYQLGYYAAASNWDGKYHKLRVTCKRRGVHIQAKSGYFAWAVPPGEGSEEAIRAEATAPYDAAEIGLTGSLSMDSKNKKEALLNVRIDAQDLAFGEQGDKSEAQLRMALVGYFKDGKIQGSPVAPLDLHYSAAEREKARNEGIPISRGVEISDQLVKVRLIVFDRGSNSIGSLTIPVNMAQ